MKYIYIILFNEKKNMKKIINKTINNFYLIINRKNFFI